MIATTGFSLDRVIREVTAGTKGDHNNSTVVTVVESHDGKWWQPKKKRYFLVSHCATSRSVAEGIVDVRVEDFSESLKLDLSIGFRIRCPKRDAEIAAKALAADESPTERFVKLIHDWVADFAARNGGDREL